MKAPDTNVERILVSVPEFCAMTGVRRSTGLNLVSAGEVESVRIGRRRLVVAESIHRFVARLRAEQKSLKAEQPLLENQ